MKKIILLTLASMIGLFSLASQLVLIPTGSLERTKTAFNQKGLAIHFYNDQFAVGTSETALPFSYSVLDEYAWTGGNAYYILYYNASEREAYTASIKNSARVLHEGPDFMVVAVDLLKTDQLYPAIHGGMVRISQVPARFPAGTFHYESGDLSARNDIFAMIAQVDTARLRQTVQHLQDFGTRNAYKSGGIEAQNWIFSKFDSLGLEVELHDFSIPNGPASDNVIATLTGTKFPDEYVVLGAHYDSYAGGSYEPGADDNATGTAGILEIARILSQYEFDRSIIFATWSGEEYGLYGSEAWANEAAQNDMNILGYFNSDMAGYLEPGDEIHTDIIAPASANELKQFYKDVCAVYLPDFVINNGALSGGDSDHTSFNNAGYQGIFPFEDSQNYSPYIHTTNDIVDLSVNNFEQHGVFVQATLASVASMADLLPSPQNLVAMAGDNEVVLEWTGVDSADHYNIYRNDDPVPYATTPELTYLDTAVVNGEEYTYYVTATFLNTGDESGPSNLVTVVPMPPISFPFYDDFETGGPYWSFQDSWGIQSGIYHSASNSMTESTGGDYQPNLDISSTLRAINLTGATSAEISFWTRYQIETDYDYMFLEVSTDGTNWIELAEYTGNQNTWTQKTYFLNDYLNEMNVLIRFHFTSDNYIEEEGMFIDDVEIDVVGVGIGEKPVADSKYMVRVHPNPAGDFTTVDYTLPQDGRAKLQLTDASGKIVKIYSDDLMNAGTHTRIIDLSGLENGTYYLTLEGSGIKTTRKIILSR